MFFFVFFFSINAMNTNESNMMVEWLAAYTLFSRNRRGVGVYLIFFSFLLKNKLYE